MFAYMTYNRLTLVSCACATTSLFLCIITLCISRPSNSVVVYPLHYLGTLVVPLIKRYASITVYIYILIILYSHTHKRVFVVYNIISWHKRHIPKYLI